MLYDIKELNENDYKKECTRLLIAFENLNYKQENAIHIAKNVTIGYGLDLKTGSNPKLLLEGYLLDDSKKLKIGDEELTFYEIIEKYRANKTGFTDPKIVKGYLQNRVFNFSLTQEQAQKVLERTFDSYKKYVSQYISDSLLRYSQEKASLVFLHYHGRFNNIKNSVRNSIIKNSRFLSWFILRYKTNINTYVGYIARSADEADIYLSNPNINKISLIFDIFSHLNIRKESISYRKYKYDESIKSYTSHNKKDILLELALWYENDLDFIRFNSANKVSNISKSNITNIISQLTKKPINNITTILHPYLTYINQTFAKGAVSEYTLNNIYVLKEIKDCENLNVALSNRNDTRDFTPLLIICLKPNTQSHQNIDTYSIEQTKNTFISIVVFEGAKLNINTIDTQKSEILYARLKDENTIEVIHLQGSHQSMILESFVIPIFLIVSILRLNIT
ncbi:MULTISPECIES: hypothetical protein [Helicobacter]|uniref:Uncharacterized protein n=1 Tax=Helicobacter bilis ATCC 43879 TaxID=613026 RepID=T5LTY0_9HELI|nr:MULTISPECIES: hypothetical protein [Helicobacter]EQM94670.1 hypothetical protein HRAG_02278 [Helicobacter bilis ATCC 43879]